MTVVSHFSLSFLGPEVLFLPFCGRIQPVLSFPQLPSDKMFAKITAGYTFLSLLLATEQVLGRERWLERDNRPVYLYPRRFGQEQPAVLRKLQTACPGEVCGNLAGQAVTPLLAGQPECSQQDLADKIIGENQQHVCAYNSNFTYSIVL